MQSLDDIYLFKKVVDFGSVSAASRALRIPKSTVTRRISLLEERLGSPLFHRSPQGLTLTNFGQECHVRAARLADTAEHMFEFVDRRREDPSGFLHIIYPATIGAALIEPLAVNFIRMQPQVQLHLEASTELIDPRSISADLVLHFAFNSLPDADFIARKLYVNPFVLVTHPDVFKGRRLPEEPQALQGLPCLGFGPKSSTWNWRLQKQDRTYTHNFTPALSTFQLSALVTAVRRAAGIASVPLNIVEQEIAKGTLCRVVPEWSALPAVLYAIYPSRRSLTTAAWRFLEVVQEHFRSQSDHMGPYPVYVPDAGENTFNTRK
jgi:DNA-binding transcriptional LysR family regulator